jgi:hypothetical protein
MTLSRCARLQSLLKLDFGISTMCDMNSILNHAML